MQERSLDPQKLEQMKSDLASGMKLLAGKHPDWDQSDPTETIDVLCEGIADGSVFMLEVAAILADCLVKATDWKLVSLERDKIASAAVVSPDGSYATYPELVAAKAFRNPDESTLKPYFEMIKNGSIPPSSPGSYTILSLPSA